MAISLKYTMRSLFAVVLSLGISQVKAQRVDSLFAATPREVLAVVDRSARLDLLDLYNSGLTARVENLLGGQTEMTAKDSTSLTLKTSESGTWKMVVVPLGDGPLLLTLHTLRAGGESTLARLYDVHWHPLKQTVPTPPFKEFWCPAVGMDPNMERVYRVAASQAPVRIDWDAATQSLLYTVSTEGLAEEMRTAIEQCLCPVKQPLFPTKKQ